MQLVKDLVALKFLGLRLHIPFDELPPYHIEKKLPYGISITRIGEAIIHKSAITLLRSIIGNPSNLRLLIFEIRGYERRHCFTRGWSPVRHRSNHFDQIDEELVKYHLAEYQLMPPYAPEDTWRDYCVAKRFRIEEKLHQEAIARDQEINWLARCVDEQLLDVGNWEPRYRVKVMEAERCISDGVGQAQKSGGFCRIGTARHMGSIEEVCEQWAQGEVRVKGAERRGIFAGLRMSQDLWILLKYWSIYDRNARRETSDLT